MTISGNRMHALSVDVEDYFHVEAFTDQVPREAWNGYESRVEANTNRLLELFAKHNARATFFILGWVAERFPRLVRDIAIAGHEIGCHSYAHYPIWKLTPAQFREDTARALMAIEDASGKAVDGYRAPTFSVVKKTLWAIPILAEAGFKYDSSVYPTVHDKYGMPDAPRFSFRWQIPGSPGIYEVPMTTARCWNRNFPASGGGYLRMLPFWYTKWALNSVVRDEHRPLNIYLHPWEIDADQPRMRGPWKSRLRHYTNLGKMESRLAELLSSFHFVSMQEMLDAESSRRTIEEIPLEVRPMSIPAMAGKS